MKTILLLILAISPVKGFSQDSIEAIDSCVKEINSKEYSYKVDSSAIPSFANPISKVYLIQYFTDSSNLKRIQWVSEFYIKSKKDKVITTSMFYYYENKLIKYEGSKVDDNNLTIYDPYYYRDNSLLFTASSAKDKDKQADFFLQYGNQFLQEFLNKK